MTSIKNILYISAASIFLAALFVSCKKNKDITIVLSGNVNDQNFGKKVNGASVSISSKKIENGSYNTSYKPIATTTTDVNGNYTFTFTRETVIDYKLVVSKENYFTHEEIISPDDVSTENGNIANVSFIPQSWIKVHIANENPINSDDRVDFSFYENTYNCEDCCNTLPITLYGKNVDTTYKCITWANKIVKHQALVYKLQISVKNGEIFTPHGDTAILEFSY
ncbi:MAG: carboxypeptidase-like regulatory domain-containing protein [Bacteroidia bacterium]